MKTLSVHTHVDWSSLTQKIHIHFHSCDILNNAALFHNNAASSSSSLPQHLHSRVEGHPDVSHLCISLQTQGCIWLRLKSRAQSRDNKAPNVSTLQETASWLTLLHGHVLSTCDCKKIAGWWWLKYLLLLSYLGLDIRLFFFFGNNWPGIRLHIHHCLSLIFNTVS